MVITIQPDSTAATLTLGTALKVPWLVLPLRALALLLIIILTLGAVGVLATMLRTLQPVRVRAWWNAPISRIRQIAGGALGAKVAVTLEEEIEQNRREDEARDAQLKTLDSRITRLARAVALVLSLHGIDYEEDDDDE
jgi:hypothetical protein